MNTVSRRGVTALTAAAALAIGVIPAAFTTSSILAAGEGPTTLDAGTWVSAGSLELATTSNNRASITLVDASGTETVQTMSASNCVPLVSSGPSLLSFTGAGKAKGNSIGAQQVGLLKGSFGVQDKGTGTSCGQVDAVSTESLTLSLGTDAVGVLGLPVLASSATLDVDVKGGARVVATASGPDGSSFQRILQSGSLLPGDANDPTVEPCQLKSDSGPDSGANDNCDWTIQAPDADHYFTSLKLTASTGSFALSGGADYATNPGAHRSSLELVEQVDGDLCVGDAYPLDPSEDGTTPGVIVTRLGNADSTAGDCVPYRFTNGSQNAELLKPIDQEASAQFHFEFTWTVPADTSALNDTETDGLVRRTSVDFDGDGTADDETVIAGCPDLTTETFTRTNSDGQEETFDALVVDGIARTTRRPRTLPRTTPGRERMTRSNSPAS